MDYLKCEYGPGLFKHEYAIKFRGDNRRGNWCWVNKEDVKSLDEKNGLVKLRECSKPSDGMVLVHINDVGDHRVSPFVVYLEDIIHE